MVKRVDFNTHKKEPEKKDPYKIIFLVVIKYI